MRLSHFVISLPLVLSAAQFSQPIFVASAAAMDAQQATELLAKSHAVNVKCNILGADQSQSLKDLVARAEISLAEQASVSTARKAIAGGKAAGQGALCDETAKKLVYDVLSAANAAVAAPMDDQVTQAEPAQRVNVTAPPQVMATNEPTQENAIAVAEPEPVAKPKVLKTVKLTKPATKVKLVAASTKPEKPTKIIKPTKGLKSYASVAEKYYVASRCGTMSKGEINALYKQVLNNHQQALASNRPRDVRIMLQSAEARAGAKSCG